MTTSAEVRALLRKRYQHPEWALCFEVANATGTNARRYADAVAMNLFPSRGLSIHGFEIKVSKSDFMNEIANPEKSAAVQQYCDHWWIVAPASAVDESLLPKTWGWLRVDTGKLVQVKGAPDLEAKPVTRAFMAALVRRANEADAGEVTKMVEDRVSLLRENDQKHVERQISERTRKGAEAIKQLEELKDKLGSDGWRHLDNDEIARAVKLVQESGLTRTYSGLRTLEKSMQQATKQLSKALDGVMGKQLDMLDAAE